MRFSVEETLDFIYKNKDSKAVYYGENIEKNGDMYFIPEEDIGCDIDNLLKKIEELQEENDRLYGENLRLKGKR